MCGICGVALAAKALGARRIVSEHQAGRRHSSKLWRLRAFGVWMQDTLPKLHSWA
jgi:hypothetical protein